MVSPLLIILFLKLHIFNGLEFEEVYVLFLDEHGVFVFELLIHFRRTKACEKLGGSMLFLPLGRGNRHQISPVDQTLGSR